VIELVILGIEHVILANHCFSLLIEVGGVAPSLKQSSSKQLSPIVSRGIDTLL